MRRSFGSKLKTITLLMVGAVLIGTFGTAMVGASSTDPPSDVETPASHPDVSVPDLNDPAVRRQFACRFEPGSFGIPPQSAATDSFCDSVDALEAATAASTVAPGIPDLNDAALRQQFACRFEAGSFGISQSAPTDNTYCERGSWASH